MQITEKNEFLKFKFKTSFQINHQKHLEKEKGIYLDSKEISRNHCVVHWIDNIGFFIQDVGSTNHTYIKLTENGHVVLVEGMEILMGDSLFEVTNIESNKVLFDILIDYDSEEPKEEKLEVKFNKSGDDIYFGKKPTSGKQNLEFNKDPEIDDEHAIFKKNDNKFLFCPLLTINKSKN